MNITIRQLKVFETVARHMGFTRAAEELHLTQPAVSMQVKQLEEQVGLPLFEKVGKKIFLTDAGREMYHYSRTIAQQLEEAEEAIETLKGVVKGELRVAVVTTAKYFMPHLLGAFLQSYPEVLPSLKVTNRASVIERLMANKDDLFIMGQVPDNLDAVAYPFLENELVVVAHPDHPLVNVPNLSLRRLSEERFLMREPGSGTRLAVNQLFAQQDLKLETYMELGSSESIKQGVLAGLGVSVMSLHNMRVELAGGHMAVLDVEGFPLQRQWYAVHLKGKRLSLVARTFLDFLLRDSETVLQGTPQGTGNVLKNPPIQTSEEPNQ